MVWTARGEDPAALQIRVVEGEGAIYQIGSRATRGLTVEVSDETGKPVEGATVSFRLPEDGAGGVFSTGAKTEIVTTHADGRAAVWGMQWNRSAGSFEVRITALKGQTRAGAVCGMYLSAPVPGKDAPPAKTHSSSSGHKWLWIALAVAGAAGAGVATMGLAGKASPAAAPATPLQIGSPTIGLGHP